MNLLNNVNRDKIATISHQLAVNPTTALFGGVVTCVVRTVLNDICVQSSIRNECESISSWISSFYKIDNNFYNEAFTRASELISNNLDSIYQNGTQFLSKETSFNLLYIPVLIVIPNVLTIANRVLFKKEASPSYSLLERIHTELTSRRVYNVSMTILLAASALLISEWVPFSQSSEELLKLSAFAGALAFANQANRHMPHTYLSVASTILINTTAIAVIFATPYSEGGFLDTIVTTFSVYSIFNFSKKITKFVQKKLNSGYLLYNIYIVDKNVKKLNKHCRSLSLSKANTIHQYITRIDEINRTLGEATDNIVNIYKLYPYKLPDNIEHIERLLVKVKLSEFLNDFETLLDKDEDINDFKESTLNLYLNIEAFFDTIHKKDPFLSRQNFQNQLDFFKKKLIQSKILKVSKQPKSARK